MVGRYILSVGVGLPFSMLIVNENVNEWRVGGVEWFPPEGREKNTRHRQRLALSRRASPTLSYHTGIPRCL